MGKLVEGVWHDVWYETKSSGGKFVREDAGFRNWIKNKPDATFQPESSRFTICMFHSLVRGRIAH